MRIFDATLSTLERSLDVRLSRQAVLAGNVANADTPGFRPRDLDFAAAMAASSPGAARAPGLAGAARSGDLLLSAAGAMQPDAPEAFVGEVAGAGAGLDGNAVDLDRTLVAVSENALQYGAAAKAAGKKLAILRYAANDGQG
ncbi:MAG: flagellar basal body rod protein FlgB [Anaeromyxobacter sp.]|nr:flagellar basal body rod protein FlgB [Anaeromyxobacter sp.]MBL0276207.1 flagellar basal body rod protein FlgB [Anaeromyxobacter sp.]